MALKLSLGNLKKLEKRCLSSCVCVNSDDCYILSSARTPFGRFQGKLNSLTAIELGTKALAAAVERSKVAKEDVGELILGCVHETGLGQSPARQVALSSGLPPTVNGTSVNNLCASGLKAIIFGVVTILTNTREVVAVGGIESLSNVPYILNRKIPRLGNFPVLDSIFLDGLNDPVEGMDVTAYAESIAQEHKCTREEQDQYAVKSHEKAAAAHEKGLFADEMIPIVLKVKGKEEIIREDEQIKNFDVEKIKNAEPDLKGNGTITSRNSSGLNDGGAFVLLATGNYVLQKKLQPLARIVSFAECAVDKRKFCLAPTIAVPEALSKADLCPENICLWEISETFAIVPLLNAKLLKLDSSRVNVHGGAISLGHPYGATGPRLVGHLAHVLKKGEFGCATISSGAGGASAIIIEKM